MIQINLLRQYPRKVGTRILSWPSSRQVGTLLVFAMLSHAGWQYLTFYHRKSEAVARIDALERRQKEVEASQAELSQFRLREGLLKERLESIKRLRAQRKGPLDLVNAITQSLPRLPTLWLTVLKEENRVVNIEGKALTLASINSFIANLERSPALTRVDLSGWEADGGTLRFRAKSEISY